MMYYLYILKTTKCNKVYVGITKDPKRRERDHKNTQNLKWGNLTKCGRAVKRYGADSFSLVIKAKSESKEEIIKLEKEWIARFGYKRLWNSSRGGEYK